MYSKEALADIFQRILKYEQDAKSAYDSCIQEIAHEHSINILKSISDEEEGYIEQEKKLFKIIEEEIPEEPSSI